MGGTIDGRAAVTRLLQRTGFGAAPAEVDAAVAAGFPATVDRVLAVPGSDPGAAATPAPDLAYVARPGKGDKDARKHYQQQSAEQNRQLQLWWLDRMVTVQYPWTEKRTLLWHGHWATSNQKVKSAAAMLGQNETERRLGGGDFQAFARAMTVDPALMIWLDASGNTAKAPNENLGRELMELFTLGVGHYTENDVRQAARALTGWRVDRKQQTLTAAFDPDRHATGGQTILGVSKEFSANDLVDLLVAQPNSARYLATRMWGWLVAPTPPPARSMDRITAAYGPNRDLTAMFKAMFTDPAFTDPASVLVKQPIEYLVGALRALGLRPSKIDKKTQAAVLTGLAGMGQVPFEPPNVGGWPTGSGWLTTSAARARIDLAARLARAADLTALTAQPAASRPDQLAGLLGVGAWTPRTRAVLAGAASDPAELVTLALSAPEYAVSR